MYHAIQIQSDGKTAWKEIFRLMRKYHCDVTFVRDNVYIVPQVVLDELSQNGICYETATLTPQESKEFQLLSFLEKRLLA
jgi:hypothetical protein